MHNIFLKSPQALPPIRIAATFYIPQSPRVLNENQQFPLLCHTPHKQQRTTYIIIILGQQPPLMCHRFIYLFIYFYTYVYWGRGERIRFSWCCCCSANIKSHTCVCWGNDPRIQSVPRFSAPVTGMAMDIITCLMFMAIVLLKQYLNGYIVYSRRHDSTYPLLFIFFEDRGCNITELNASLIPSTYKH